MDKFHPALGFNAPTEDKPEDKRFHPFYGVGGYAIAEEKKDAD